MKTKQNQKQCSCAITSLPSPPSSFEVQAPQCGFQSPPWESYTLVQQGSPSSLGDQINHEDRLLVVTFTHIRGLLSLSWASAVPCFSQSPLSSKTLSFSREASLNPTFLPTRLKNSLVGLPSCLELSCCPTSGHLDVLLMPTHQPPCWLVRVCALSPLTWAPLYCPYQNTL